MTTTGGMPESSDERRLPNEVVENLLDDEACRRILSHLSERDGSATVTEIGRALAAAERDDDAAAVSDETVAEYRDAVFQRHLPRLTPTGVVSYDSMLATVSLETSDERIITAIE